jgi:hypothetical protein
MRGPLPLVVKGLDKMARLADGGLCNHRFFNKKVSREGKN